jgi:hypothetical protein
MWMLSASTRLGALLRAAHEALVLGGCLGHTLEFFRRFLIFRCTTRGTKHHEHVEAINNGAIAPNQSLVPLGFSALLFSGQSPNIDTVCSPLSREV